MALRQQIVVGRDVPRASRDALEYLASRSRVILLEEGIRETVAIFREQMKAGRFDASDLDAPKPLPVTMVDEV